MGAGPAKSSWNCAGATLLSFCNSGEVQAGDKELVEDMEYRGRPGLPGIGVPEKMMGSAIVPTGPSSYSLAQGPGGPTHPAAYLVFVERTISKGELSDVCSTSMASGRQSSTASPSTCRGIAVLQTNSALTVPPAKIDKGKLEAFVASLEAAGLDLSRWGIRGTKSVEHLFWEAYHQRGCIIAGLGGGGHSELKRVTRLVKIRLTAEIFGVVHTLCSRMQFMHDGQTIERRQVPLRRLKWMPNAEEASRGASLDVAFYAEQCPYTEDWRTGCRRALEERLGLKEPWQQGHLLEDVDAYTYNTEDDVKSDGYPGLNTLYCIHEVTFRVLDPEHPQVQCIGLPQGQEFATTEGDFNFNGYAEDALPIGTQLNIWTWSRDAPVGRSTRKSRRMEGAITAASEPPPPAPTIPITPVNKDLEGYIKRVPLPATAATAIAGMQMRMARKLGDPPCPALHAALENQRTDWARVKKIARSIADPKYTLAQFNEDLSAFPELNLYLFQENNGIGGGANKGASGVCKTATVSGRTIGDEYQRTVGAFFAIYWLMRMQGDGKEGFTFGVDDDWAVTGPERGSDGRLYPKDKRLMFYREGKWEYFRKLLLDAELLKEEKRSFGRSSVLKVNEHRLVSLLALTAIHDIMKMGLMLPQVQEKDAPYHGYEAGDTISDHDHALSYVMDHYPDLLPSFRDLDPEERRSVHFTQCNLCFNHGWFVQAEAPPGATFTKFRDALIRDHKSQIGRTDVALYFVHWLTDLAGAEPTPLGGCEKFVIKFPLPVLNSFLRSFELVQKITDLTETEVMEEYLKIRWAEHLPSPGPLPTGDTAIAKMRILCMAQMNAGPFLKAFDELLEDDREALSVEMSRTGTLCQSYSRDLVPRDVHTSPAGPAFLIYYGPAFLQNLGNDDPVRRLSVLAEVYRRARELWPLHVAKAAQNVIIRVDMIKSLSTTEMLEAMETNDVWLMLKHNDTEAFIERSSRRKLNKLIAAGQHIQILDLSNVRPMGSFS